MRKMLVPTWIFVAASIWVGAQQPSPDGSWVKKSDGYTQQLTGIDMQHRPEAASRQGLVQYDNQISSPTLADDQARRADEKAVLAKLKTQESVEKDKNVLEDLAILRKALDLRFRREDFALAHEVPFNNASEVVYNGVRVLLDDQVAAERRPSAVIRLRKYAGLEPGYKQFAGLLRRRAEEQMSKPGAIYPSKDELETRLGRNRNFVDEIANLFKKYKLTGWEAAYSNLQVQLADYDSWVRANVLPKARSDFRLPAEAYLLALEGYGIDIPPEQIAAMAHKAFAEYQAEMAPLAAGIAKQKGYKSSDYRDVIGELKRTQITGEAIMPFYEKRLREIEGIITSQNLVKLPERPAIIRLATAAETAQQPAPHMAPPPFMKNTGQRGEFVLPLNIPSATGGEDDRYDDFTFDAVSWTLIAHEARPGHELQFDSMVEHGVSLARVLYAFNSANVEGWGLYAEYMMKPYMPLEGQLMSLDLRLLRAARAFLDPELQSGKETPADAYRVLERDVVLSHAFAKEEVERFTFRMPGQANSYFYGYTRLLDLRKKTEAALGKKFDQRKFHDFILAQGLLPPDLMAKAVLEEFIPTQK